MTTMAHPAGETVTISVRRPIDDPVFVAGTFSEPQWEPLELSSKMVDTEPDEEGLVSTEYLFYRELELSPGQYQYRFREGASGPWFHDEAVKHGTLKPFFSRRCIIAQPIRS